MVPEPRSITGVLVMPISGVILKYSATPGTVVTPAAGLMRLLCQRGTALLPRLSSASKAYTLSCSVATNTTLCVPRLGMARFDT